MFEDIIITEDQLPDKRFLQRKDQDDVSEAWLYYAMDWPRVHFIPYFNTEPPHYVHTKCWCDPKPDLDDPGMYVHYRTN